MDKLYTEEQYKQYDKIMGDMANTDDIIVSANIHFQLEQWIKDNNISEEALNQMDERMEEETEELMKKLKEQ